MNLNIDNGNQVSFQTDYCNGGKLILSSNNSENYNEIKIKSLDDKKVEIIILSDEWITDQDNSLGTNGIAYFNIVPSFSLSA